MKSWIKSIRARQRGSPQRGIVAFFNVATRDFFFFFSHRENRAKANKDREGRGLRPLAFSCRCTPKSIDDDHPSCKAIVDRGQGGRSNDASSVNQAISFREEANEDTAWTTIDFLLTILSLEIPPRDQSRGWLSFVAFESERESCSLRFLLPGAKLFFFFHSLLSSTSRGKRMLKWRFWKFV